MGLSSNQARFLSLTSRQIDLEQRIQQICQRRLRLSGELEKVAMQYNNQTSDRRLFLNTANSYSSAAPGPKGPLTPDILTDNNAYELLTAQNLYDNGLHLFMNGALLNVDSNGIIKKRTGNIASYDQTTIGNLNVGDWYSPVGNLSYRITSKTLNPNTYTIIPPLTTELGAASNNSTTGVVAGVANTTTQYSAWTGGNVSQDPATGIATQIFTRTGSVENAFSPGFIAPIQQLTPAQITAAATTAGTTIINSKQDFLNLVTGINNSTIDTTDKTYILNSDIDLAGQTFTNSAVINVAFNGTFNGNGHTINNANLTTDGTAASYGIGLFKGLNASATVENLNIDNFHISSTADSISDHSSNCNYVGTLSGYSYGAIDNVNVKNSSITLGNNYDMVGGLTGTLYGSAGKITNSSSDTDITVGNSAYRIAGIVGDFNSLGQSTLPAISNTYSTGNIVAGGTLAATSYYIAGFAASANVLGISEININNCYSTGNVSTAYAGNVGGFIAGIRGGSVTNSYTTGNATFYNGAMYTPAAGFDGNIEAAPYVGASNFYKNSSIATIGTAVNANVSAMPTGSWDTNIWDKSGALPVFNTNHKTTTTWTETITKTANSGTNHIYQADEYTTVNLSSDDLDSGLRTGNIQLAKHADAMTQNVLEYSFIQGAPEKFELVDWRTQPIISDDLYGANDTAAQTVYDQTVREVNSQDKKLQLEQTNIETEYKAVTSEKEAVNKILDTNVKSSFKYFS